MTYLFTLILIRNVDKYALISQKESVDAFAQRVRNRLTAAELSEEEWKKWVLHVVEGTENDIHTIFHAQLGDSKKLDTRIWELDKWLSTVICTCARRVDCSSAAFAVCEVHKQAYLQIPHAAPNSSSMRVTGGNFIFLALEHPAPPDGTGVKSSRS